MLVPFLTAWFSVLHQPFTHMKNWGFLLLAILSETIATSALKALAQFTRWAPSLLVVVGYGLAFYFLSLTLRTIPVGIAYAIWSGIGIVLVTLAGIFLYRQVPDTGAVVGILFIIVGVAIINLFSKAATH